MRRAVGSTPPEGGDRPASEFGKGLDGKEQLPPELQQAFDQIVTRLGKRRRVHLFGYLTAVIIVLLGVPAGLYYMGIAPEGASPRGWALLVPVALAALVLFVFGRWAKRL